MLQLCQIDANIAAFGKAICGETGEPDRRKQQDRTYREPDMEPVRTFAPRELRLCAQVVHINEYEYMRSLAGSGNTGIWGDYPIEGPIERPRCERSGQS